MFSGLDKLEDCLLLLHSFIYLIFLQLVKALSDSLHLTIPIAKHLVNLAPHHLNVILPLHQLPYSNILRI